jgi:hypothetical protein
MAMIDQHGWAFRFVFDAEGKEPNFHYSAGITDRCGCPELLVFGLAREVGSWVINEYARRCVAGDVFKQGRAYSGFIEGYDIVFLDVDSRLASVENDYTTWTDWYYERKGFSLRQLVWPDKTGTFPWQAGFREEFRRLQPILGEPPIALGES